MKRQFKLNIDGVIYTHPKEFPTLADRLAMYKQLKPLKQFIVMIWG